MTTWLRTRAERARYALWLTASQEVINLNAAHEARVRLIMNRFDLDCVKVNARYGDVKVTRKNNSR